jgi:hypothetical protein
MAVTAGGPVLSSGAVEPAEAFVFNAGSSLESNAVAGVPSVPSTTVLARPVEFVDEI